MTRQKFRRRRASLAGKVQSNKTPSRTQGEMFTKAIRVAFAEIQFDSELPALHHAIYLCSKLSAAASAGALRASDSELHFVRKLARSINPLHDRV
jgi:hypothetical protein